MLKLVKEYLKKQEWQFSELDEKNIFLFGIGGKNGNFQCIADVFEDEQKLVFFSICGANTPIEKRNEVLDLLNQLNYNFFLGHFEMDNEAGEIRYKTSILYKHITPTEELIDQILMTNIVTMDTYLPAIMGVMFGGQTPAQAIELIDTNDISTPEK